MNVVHAAAEQELTSCDRFLRRGRYPSLVDPALETVKVDRRPHFLGSAPYIVILVFRVEKEK